MNKIFTLFILFSFVRIGFCQQGKDEKASRKSVGKSKKETNAKVSEVPKGFFFAANDSAISGKARKLSVLEAGNYAEPLVVILLTDSLEKVKSFHSTATSLEASTKNGIRSLAIRQKDGMARAILINTPQALENYFRFFSTMNFRVAVFSGFDQLTGFKFSEFLALDNKYFFRKILPESNINIFPGQSGPVEFIQKDEIISN